MSSNTKIVVLKAKELIYTAVFLTLGIFLILLIWYMFSPHTKNEDASSNETNPSYISEPTDTTDTTDITDSTNITGSSITTDSENINDSANNNNTSGTAESSDNTANETVSTLPLSPGVYTSVLSLGDYEIELNVTVNNGQISNISAANIDENVTTLYPLLLPSIDSINSQLGSVTTLDDIKPAKNQEYTTIIIIDAIKKALTNISETN